MQEELHCKIQGVQVFQLNQIADERGIVLHLMRSDSPHFREIGEIYFSEINPGIVKAWKKHKLMTQNLSVPAGRIRLVFFDDRDDSPSKGTVEELILGRPDRYCLVRIPPLLWYGFQGISEIPSLIVNCTDLPHDPNESMGLDSSSSTIPYKWPT